MGKHPRNALELTLPLGVSAPTAARAASDDFARHYDLRSRSDLALVVSELVTRRVVDGDGGRITLRLTISEDNLLHGEIVDQGEPDLGPDEHIRWRVVDQLTTAWGIHGGSSHIWFEMRLSEAT